jgi:glycyl-tRNA synthetase beta subunit
MRRISNVSTCAQIIAHIDTDTYIYTYKLQVLTEALPGLLASLSFRKSMKWGRGDVAFSRPVRWLLALMGETELPFVWAGLQAGRTTRLLRNADQAEAQVGYDFLMVRW